jgi:hypothetical protein
MDNVVLHTCNLATRKRKILNPFTRGFVEAWDDDGLTPTEREAVKGLFAAVKAKGPDKDGNYVVKMPDKGRATISAMVLEGEDKITGAFITVDKDTPQITQFVYDLGRLGNLSIESVESVDEDSAMAVTSEENRAKIAGRHPQTVVVRSAEELRILSDKGLRAWQAYRRRH